MDDLEALRDLYGEPAADASTKARVRERLEAERRRHERSRLSWAFAAIAAIAAVAVASMTINVGGPGGHAPPDGPVMLGSGRSVLLAAAATAEATPAARPARYWHVKKLHRQTRPDHSPLVETRLTELWAARDGRAWRGSRPLGLRPRGEPGNGRDVSSLSGTRADGGHLARLTGEPAFSMHGRPLTVEQIEALPADAGALKAWVTRTVGDVSEGVLADALSGLLWTKPSPPKVRAAAYRALADLPNVRYLGAATDHRGRAGEAFSFALGDRARTLIIDPDSSQVLSSTLAGGPPQGHGEQVEVILEAGWTDRGPAVVRPVWHFAPSLEIVRDGPDGLVLADEDRPVAFVQLDPLDARPIDGREVRTGSIAPGYLRTVPVVTVLSPPAARLLTLIVPGCADPKVTTENGRISVRTPRGTVAFTIAELTGDAPSPPETRHPTRHTTTAIAVPPLETDANHARAAL